MAIATTSILASLLIGGFGLAFLVGTIFLQITLSKKESKWLGLILPLICLMFSFTAVLSVPAYTGGGQLTLQETLPDGTVVEHEVEQDIQPVTNTGSVVARVAVVFVIYNVPTVVLMLIYFSGRQKIKKTHEIDKMNIQDLE